MHKDNIHNAKQIVMGRIKNPIKIFKGVFALKDDPDKIAKGFALGSFIGMMPIPGFQMVVSLTISAIIRVNKKAACIGVFNTNIATGAFIFAFNFWLGKKILNIQTDFTLPSKLSFDYMKTVFSAGADVYISLIAGGVITGIISAFIGYYLVKIAFKKRSKRTKLTQQL
jgi:uncharacterized protein (DUF2062 family)